MNYNKFYNAWQSFAKSNRQLLTEQEPKPVVNSQLDVGPEQHSFKVVVKSSAFVKLTTDEAALKDVERRAKEKGKFDPGRDTKMYLFLNQNGQVIKHEGRARNLANIYTNGPDATVEIEIVIPKNLSLTLKDIPKVTGEVNIADDVHMSLEELIPGLVEKPTVSEAEKKYLEKLDKTKKELGSGLVFKRKVYPSSRPGGPPVKDTFTAELKLRGFLDPIFALYKKFKISENPQAYNVGAADSGGQYLPGSQLAPMRKEFAQEMNNHFKIINNEGKMFNIVDAVLSGGTFAFSLKNADSTPETESDKDNVTFISK